MRKVQFLGLCSKKEVKFTNVNEQLFCKCNDENELLSQTENSLFIPSINLYLKSYLNLNL